jgi:CDP-diacylglycerol---glycerol-3-phosphate 3-phosphatidyltransferase
MTLSDYLRKLTNPILSALGQSLHRLGVHPDAVTVLGLLITLGASVLLALGYFQAGGVVLLLGLPLDALDGALARARRDASGQVSSFGAVLDSTLDRYADGFIFIALGYYFAMQERFDLLLLSQLALLGSLLVSYVRARADGVAVNAPVGIFTRLERIIVILVMLLLPALLAWGLLLLAIGTHITVLQRLIYVSKQLNQDGN